MMTAAPGRAAQPIERGASRVPSQEVALTERTIAAAARPRNDRVIILVLMGVSGSGKSTVGRSLARRLGWTFQEGDDLHPAANIAKMSAGIALTDGDRAPWLRSIAARMDEMIAAGRSAVISCSALKRAYRDKLVRGRPQVRFVFLHGKTATLKARLERRRGHFMPPNLLASQLADLEPPAPTEHAITIEIEQPVGAQVSAIIAALHETTHVLNHAAGGET